MCDCACKYDNNTCRLNNQFVELHGFCDDHLSYMKYKATALFEYRVIEPLTNVDLQNTLNELTKSGWEIDVAITGGLILKRKLKEPNNG